MEVLKTIPTEAAVLIPRMQLEFTREGLKEYSSAVFLMLQAQLRKCPGIKETNI